MKKKAAFVLLITSFSLIAAEKHLPTVRERAASMFRKPSGEEVKIDPKFQPIDHTIKGTRPAKKKPRAP